MKKCVCGEEMTPADWKNQWVCHRCGRTKPMSTTLTNADRIRAMDDVELAEFLYQVGYDNGWGMPEFALEWLQQPAGEDTHA